ncbi:MAG: DUF6600 domain-containing protein [bacterium]
MRTMIIAAAVLLTGLLGCPAGTAGAANAADNEADGITDVQAVQALRDIGLPPESLLAMIKETIQESASAGDSVDYTATDGTGMTDEQAVQALYDLGIPPRTILAMIRKQLLASIQEGMGSAPAPAGGDGSSTRAIIVQNLAPAAVAPPVVKTVDDFYGALAPHGVWITVAPYGRVWQPLVTVFDSSWRPYYDNGSWEWTDDGWCWRSTYSWGWAPFHYGRWTYVTGRRWVWVPDMVWAPSWVQWRHSDSYVGWAPLPPEAYYNPGLGFTYHGRGVSVDCDFGLTDWHYSFVPSHCFTETNPRRVGVPRELSRRIFSDTVSVRETHTARGNVTLPALPRTVVSNTGRRTESLQRIVTGGSAATASRTPASTPTASRVVTRSSTTGHSTPVPATVTPAQPATVQAPATTHTRSTTTSDRRSSALLDILRKKTGTTVQPPASTETPATPKPQSQTRSAPTSAISRGGSSYGNTARVSGTPAGNTAGTPSVSTGKTPGASPVTGGNRSSRLSSLLRDK